ASRSAAAHWLGSRRGIDGLSCLTGLAGPRRGSARRRLYRVIPFPHDTLSTCPKPFFAGCPVLGRWAAGLASIRTPLRPCLVLLLLRLTGEWYNRDPGIAPNRYSDTPSHARLFRPQRNHSARPDGRRGRGARAHRRFRQSLERSSLRPAREGRPRRSAD